ncbi:pyocin knob domain-containing protein [[Eubacterium] siraeum]|nr:pyocin knob domain-containing protein [[Eubacterium] siraeum]
MAENINISFAPNKSASESQRIADLEQYVSTLTERTKFAFASIIEEYNDTSADDEQTVNMIYQATSESGSDVGQFTDTDKTSEIFNDYSGNTASGNYSHVEGYKNNLKSEGSTHSWATHIEGQENTEASRTSCPSDKKASNNHIEGKLNSSYGRINHVEGVNCFAEYDTQICHVEGSNSRASEGARVTHVEGKNCVAGGNCTHAQNLGTIAEKDNCTALGKYNKDLGYVVMIGGGSSDTDRKNILTVDWDGTVRNTGGVYADGDVTGENGIFGGNLSVLGNVNFYGKANLKVPIATKDIVGGIKVGDNLSIAPDGTATVIGIPDIASSTKAGIIKVGTDLEISEDGTLSVVKGGTFPPATKTTLGGVIVGRGMSVSDSGFLTLYLSDSLEINDWNQLDIPGASSQTAGIVKIGSGITTEFSEGRVPGSSITEISVQPATQKKAGIVKIGEGLNVETDGTLSADVYPPASLFLSGASKMMLHKYIPVESKKQGYYYGSVASDIICDTIKYCSTAPDFPESYIVIPHWYASTSASAVVTDNATFELIKPIINNDTGTFTVKVECKELNYSSTAYNATHFYNTTIYLKWKSINAPTTKFQYGYVVCEVHLYYCDTSGTPQDRSLKTGYIPFASKAEYDAAICLTASERSMFDLSEEKYTLLVPNSLCLLSSGLPSTLSAEEGVIYLTPNEDNTAFKQYIWNGTEYKYLGETNHEVDLSGYLKSAEISDWAKADSKPTYTAEEIGAVTPYELDSKDYLKATEITGQTVNLDDIKLNESSDKSKSKRYFCASASAQNIENRPISANEPFELSVDNIRNINTGAFNTMQRYTSVARKRTYTRWCNDGAWSAWKCDTDVVVYGSVTEDSPKTFAYATYGEGFGVVEIEAYYDNATNPVRNRKVFSLSPTASIERVMLTISNGSSESVTLANGSITMSMTGTTALSFVIRYTNSR